MDTVYRGGKMPSTSWVGMDRPEEFRVVTYNVHGCVGFDRRTRPDRIAEVLRWLSPHLVALQEVDAERRREDNQARSVAEELGMAWAFFPVEPGVRAFGLALLSLFPLDEVKADWLPALYPRLQPRRRGVLRARLQTPGGPMHVVNTHLSLFRVERRKQVRALRRAGWLAGAREEEPFLLCGDLNGGPRSQTYRTLSRGLSDVQEKIGTPAPTYPSRRARFRVDHLLASGHFRVLRTSVLRNDATQMASDHLPLAADLRWIRGFRPPGRRITES